MSYTKFIYHLVIATHMRQRTIFENREQELYAYIGGIVKGEGGHIYEINGMPDHVHIVLSIPPSISVADFVKRLKNGTSHWIRTNKIFPYWEGWGKGYSAFTCSAHSCEGVLHYVRNQKEHHKKVSSATELTQLLRLAGFDIP